MNNFETTHHDLTSHACIEALENSGMTGALAAILNSGTLLAVVSFAVSVYSVSYILKVI